jgi:ParB family chromosome partitioning protein
MAAKHAGLGRGLNALIKDTPVPATTPPAAAQAPAAKDLSNKIPVARIKKSPWQPRHHFEKEALAELVASVKERGVLQPLLVRKVGDQFELIAGERRFRAASEAGLREVPAIVMEVSDREALELALIENLQRADLNYVEEAEGYKALADKFGMTQDEIAQRVGKSRPAVANALRLLTLSDKVKRLVAEGRLSPGHAKVLLALEIPKEQELLAERCVKEQLSVRTLERIVQKLTLPPKKPRASKTDIPETHLKYLLDALHQRLGTNVRIEPSKTLANGKKAKGCIEIDFYSGDDLDRILVILGLEGSL